MADLNSSGKMDSEMERLMRVVIERRKESRHDLRRRAGIRSREQVASEEDSMAVRTLINSSRRETGEGRRRRRRRKMRRGKRSRKRKKVERSFAILSPKKLRKEVARREWEGEVGREGEVLQERRESGEAHSFFGLLEEREIRVR